MTLKPHRSRHSILMMSPDCHIKSVAQRLPVEPNSMVYQVVIRDANRGDEDEDDEATKYQKGFIIINIMMLVMSLIDQSHRLICQGQSP